MPDLRVGGGQTLLLENIRSLDRDRFRHSICLVEPIEEMRQRFEDAGAEILDVSAMARSSEPAAALKLLKAIDRTEIDILHSNNTPRDFRLAAAASRLRRRPLLVTLHGNPGRARGFRANLYRKAVWRMARRNLTAAIAVSETVRDAWVSHFQALGLPPERLETLSPALDVGRFTATTGPAIRIAVRRELGLPPAAPILLNVSRLVPGKGHGTLLDVIDDMRSTGTVLVLAGEGPLRSEIEGEVARRGLDSVVRLLGNVSDVARLLAAADVFVFPSESESFGIAPLEAMAAGLPVVAADLPTLRSFITDGATGFVTPQGDSDAIVARVRCLLSDGGLRARIGDAARRLVERDYSSERNARRLSNLYRLAATPAPDPAVDLDVRNR